jgi:predicted GNAT family acetyltransferase
MQIQHKQNTGKGFFYIGEEMQPIAKMTYSMAGSDKMISDHTEVGDELRGKNAGYQLVAAAAESSRTTHIRITPICPVANSVFKKKNELQDVLLTY